MKRFVLSHLPVLGLSLSVILQLGCTSSFETEQGASRFLSSVPDSVLAVSSLNTNQNFASGVQANVNLSEAAFKITQSTLHLKADYPACPALPVKVQILRSGISFQSTCYTDPRNDGWGNCQHPESVNLGTSASEFLVRFSHALPSCDGYGNGYQEARPKGVAQADAFYTARAQNRLMEASQQSYEVKIDRATGAIFELYSKRANTRLNAVHSHVGAAIQVAFHDRDKKVLSENPCGGSDVKYWNPNQAGATCLYRNGVVEMVATQPNANTTKSFLSDGATLLATPTHNMMNWSYGPGYEGPWNARDVAEFSQDLKAYPDYFMVEASFMNKGIEHPNGVLEVPAFYLSSGFRRYTIQFGSNSAVSGVLPVLHFPQTSETNSETAQSNPRTFENGKYYANHKTNWVTFSNAEDSSQVYTLAWYISPELRQYQTEADVVQLQQSMFNVKFNAQVFFRAATNVTFNIRYAVFPFGIDETIRFRESRKTVHEAIQILKNEIEGSSAATTPAAPVTPPAAPTPVPASPADAPPVAASPVAMPPAAPTVVTTTPPLFNVATTTDVIPGWDPQQAIDNNGATAYSSGGFSTAIPGNNMNLHVSYANGAKHTGTAILLQARIVGTTAVGFPKVYNVYVEENGQWVPVAIGLTFAPNAEGRVLIPLNRTVQTNGVLIIPYELGQDNEGTYRFQMADIWLR